MHKSKSGLRRARMMDAITGYGFITPYVIAFFIFTGLPFIIAFAMSFVNIKFITKLENLKFVGLENFIHMFTNEDAMMALGRSITYSLVYVPVIMVLSFFLAYVLNKGVFMKKTIRSMVLMPYVSNMMAVAVVIQIIIGPQGPLVAAQKMMGSENPIIPLLNLKWALPTVALVAVWKGVGLNFLTYLGALQGVPNELMEAAELDGANRWQVIRNVIIPCVSPTTFFLTISSIITSLQNFTIIQSLTEGGPGQATTVMSVNIVRTAFQSYNTSYAAAQSLVMFAIIMCITMIQWVGQKKWVNY